MNIYWRILYHFSWAFLPVLMIWNVISSVLLINVSVLTNIIRVLVIAVLVLFLYALARSFFVKDIINKKLLRKSAVWLFVDTFVVLSSLLIATAHL